jgi:hypothetical protein
MPPVSFVWYEGKKDGKKILPPENLVKRCLAVHKTQKLVDSGSILVGSKGIIYSPNDYGAKILLDPADAFAGVNTAKPEKMPINAGGDAGMKKEWFDAMKGGPPAMSNFDYAAALTETILLGNIAIRLAGQELAWDGPAMKFTNNPSANKHLHTEYRKGWSM